MSVFVLNLDYQQKEYKAFLKNYGINEYKPHLEESLIHQFYKKIVESNVLKDSGVNYTVLTENLITKGYHKSLKEQGIYSFLRIDTDHLEAGMPTTINESLFEKAKNNGFVGVKIVSYIDNIDSIDMLTNILIRYGYRARRYKLIPIFEINVKNQFKDKVDRENELFKVLFDKLHKVIFTPIMSFSLPHISGTFNDINRFEIVKAVLGNDFQQKIDTYIEKIAENDMGRSVRDTAFTKLNISLDPNKFNTILRENLLKLSA